MSTTLKRAAGIAAVIAAIAYTVARWDFAHSGIMGLADDFFLFMAAFTLAYAQFLNPARQHIRRQLQMIALLCAILGITWIVIQLIAAG